MSKIDSVLKSLARDWSCEGREERSVVYDRMVKALEKYMPLDDGDCRAISNNGNCMEMSSENNDEQQLKLPLSTPPKVAVPGSGLGRLAWEIYSKGYSVQGSDFSLPMLLASDFMLNGCCSVDNISEEGDHNNGISISSSSSSFKQYGICPWISETKNVMSFGSRIRTVVVPDVDPTYLQIHSESDHKDDTTCEAPEFTMMAGEFLHLYSHFLPEHQQDAHHCSNNGSISQHQHQHPEAVKKFHAVACSFFIDTAPSLPHYLLTIYHMLEEGGLLLHFGPLMYHWSGHGGLLPADAQMTNTNNHDNEQQSSNIKGSSKKYQKRNKPAWITPGRKSVT